MRTETEIPEFFAEFCCILIQESGKLDLKELDIGLKERSSSALTTNVPLERVAKGMSLQNARLQVG